MGQNKEQLKKLLRFIDDLAKQEGNEWFKEEISKNYSKIKKTVNVTSDHELIEKVHEYCIQEIIQTQAQKFYSDFALSEIKSQLITDFQKMENFRRHGDFENFCLSMFQQVEYIVNHVLSKPEIKDALLAEKGTPALLKFNHELKTYTKSGTLNVGSLIAQYAREDKVSELFRKKIDDWYFANKFRAVIYYYYFNTEIKQNTEEFERIYKTGNYLYQVRNLNHRGGIKSDYQENILKEILPHRDRYYLRFMGFLEEFVRRVNDTLMLVTNISI